MPKQLRGKGTAESHYHFPQTSEGTIEHTIIMEICFPEDNTRYICILFDEN